MEKLNWVYDKCFYTLIFFNESFWYGYEILIWDRVYLPERHIFLVRVHAQYQ